MILNIFSFITGTSFARRSRTLAGSCSTRRRPAIQGCRAPQSPWCWSSDASRGGRLSASPAAGTARRWCGGCPATAAGSHSTLPLALKWTQRETDREFHVISLKTYKSSVL